MKRNNERVAGLFADDLLPLRLALLRYIRVLARIGEMIDHPEFEDRLLTDKTQDGKPDIPPITDRRERQPRQAVDHRVEPLMVVPKDIPRHRGTVGEHLGQSDLFHRMVSPDKDRFGVPGQGLFQPSALLFIDRSAPFPLNKGIEEDKSIFAWRIL